MTFPAILSRRLPTLSPTHPSSRPLARGLVVALAWLCLAPCLPAATLDWATSTVSTPADVNTDGLLVGAMNVGTRPDDTVPDQVINGVPFSPDPGGLGFLPFGNATIAFNFEGNFNNNFWSGANPGNSAAYGTALDYGRYADEGNRTGNIGLNGLKVGRRYLVQLWIVDVRDGQLASRVRTVDGTFTSAGGPNIATAVFTADNAFQAITLVGVSGGNGTPHGPQVNLVQLRDVTGVLLSTLNNPSTSQLESSAGSMAQAVDVGPLRTRLSRVTVRLASFSGTCRAEVQLWGGDFDEPDFLIADLSEGNPFNNPADVDYTFSSTTNPELEPWRRYWIVVSDASGGAGVFFWRSSSGTFLAGDPVVAPAPVRATRPAGGSWNPIFGGNRQHFSLEGPLLVTDPGDSGTGSLRQAFLDARNLPGPDLIHFASALSGQAIHLNAAISVTSTGGPVTLDASSLPAGVTIDDGTGTTHGLFVMLTGSDLTLRGLTLANGNGTEYQSGWFGGGAIFNRGDLSVERCAFLGNGVFQLGFADGGAIYSDASGSLRVSHSTFSGNRAHSLNGSRGGAIYHNGANNLSITHCTFTGNEAVAFDFPGEGGALFIDGTFDGGQARRLENSIFYGNTQTSVGERPALEDLFSWLPLQLVGVNVIGQGGANLGVPGVVLSGDPRLAPLANYGGSTPTCALRPGSVALNASSDSSAQMDQRGYRIIDVADIGAYEAGYPGTFAAWIWETMPYFSSFEQHAASYDYDLDGYTNEQEWVGLTDPSDATSRLRITQAVRDGADQVITVPSSAGRYYTLETSIDRVTWTASGSSQYGFGSPLTFRHPFATNGQEVFLRVTAGFPPVTF